MNYKFKKQNNLSIDMNQKNLIEIIFKINLNN